MIWLRPALRNVAVTKPHFSTGSVDNLNGAVNLMGEQMLGQDFSDTEDNALVAVLQVLTGEMPVLP